MWIAVACLHPDAGSMRRHLDRLLRDFCSKTIVRMYKWIHPVCLRTNFLHFSLD